MHILFITFVLYKTIINKYMVLTDKALEAINNKRTRSLIALALDVTEQMVIRYIKTNSDSLTKAAALQVIRTETGLIDTEILDAEQVAA